MLEEVVSEESGVTTNVVIVVQWQVQAKGVARMLMSTLTCRGHCLAVEIVTE